MSSRTLKALADGFLRFQKARSGRVPARYIGPGPDAKTPDENGYVPPSDHDRALAQEQIEQIAVMAQPVIERFSGEEKLIAAIQDLVSKLTLLVAQAEVKKQAAQIQPSTPSGKRFIRVVDEPLPLRPASRNSLDFVLDDASSRVAVQKRYRRH